MQIQVFVIMLQTNTCKQDPCMIFVMTSYIAGSILNVTQIYLFIYFQINLVS